MSEKKWNRRETTDGRPPAPGMEDAPAPRPVNERTGQHEAYWVLPEEERSRVDEHRQVRDTYRHVGPRLLGELRDLTPEEEERHAGCGYVKFEPYPESESPKTGRFWTREQLDRLGCGAVTTMGSKLAETWAADPTFYGSTFCVGCRGHHPTEEFVWDGTEERLDEAAERIRAERAAREADDE